MDLYVGMDVGGSRSRAAVVDASGSGRAAAEGPGGNPVSHAPDLAFRVLADTLRAALAEVQPDAVRGVVFGLAGVGTLRRHDAAHRLTALARDAGLTCPIHLVGDVVVAFAAGTPAPDGTVLVSGTGATAAQISGRTQDTVADGHGWLVGDDGSAFWIGREAARVALAALDGRGAHTALLPAVTTALLGEPLAPDAGRGGTERIVRAAHHDPPIALARLAPLVSEAAEAGDAVAVRIVARAAEALAASTSAVRTAAEPTPVVLAGSVAGGTNPVAARTRAALEKRWPGCVRRAGDGAMAAAWLAAIRCGLPTDRAAALHAALLAAPTGRAG